MVGERAAVLKTLLAHSMEEDRKWKATMIEEVAKKDEFKEEKVRNPWMMGQLNLKTPYVDTLEKRHMEE